mgnify:CR=1 FL=1
MRRILFQMGIAYLLSSCAHTLIPGTTVRDTDDNRAVYKVIEQLQDAIRSRNVDALLALVSTSYYEDMGSASNNDDYGYYELKNTILPESFHAAKEVFLTIQLHDIQTEGKTAYADVRYTSKARIEVASGSIWDSHKEFNRIEFTKEDGIWKITAGL